MLTLPDDRKRIHGGAMAMHVLRQIDDARDRENYCRRLIDTSLELALEAWACKRPQVAKLERLDQCEWRIGRLHYVFFPVANDDALFYAAEMAKKDKRLTVIVLPDCESLFRQALWSDLGHCGLSFFTFNSFLSWRATFAHLDSGWPWETVIQKLFAGYNMRVAQEHDRSELLVRLQEDEERDG